MRTIQAKSLNEKHGVDIAFSIGDTVRVAVVDMYGFNGRDLHPQPSDVGAVGRVIDVEVCGDDEEEFDENEGFVCYTVALGVNDIRVLEMIQFELEAVK
jgi:hypothetical protein